MFIKCNFRELKSSLLSYQALHFQMAKFCNFNFQNGLSFNYFISTKPCRDQDRNCVIESFVHYLENRDKSALIEFDAFRNVDFGDLPEKVKAKFGDVALFAVLDGHSRPRLHWWYDQISYNLPLALAKTFEIKIGELEDPAEILKAVAIEFPLTLHNALKDHLITMRASDSDRSYEALRSGTTLSFLIFTHELAASGIVGDSPVSLFCNIWQQNYIHRVQTADSIKPYGLFGADVTFERDYIKYYIGFPYAQDLMMYNTIGDLYYDYDIQVALHKLQFGQPLTEEEERLKGILDDCIKFNPFNRKFESAKVPPQKHDILFTRKATVRIASLKDNQVTGGVLCTDGVMEEITTEQLRNLAMYEKDGYLFNQFFDMCYGEDDKTLIEVKITTSN